MSDTTPPPHGGPDPSTPYGGQGGYGGQGAYGGQGGYGPPPGQGYGGGPVGQPPPNHLAWAIITTILCCLPLGIVSIVFAAQVNGKWSAGDVAGAQDSSRKARLFALWGTILGAVGAVLWVLLVAMGTLSMSGQPTS